MLSSSNPTTIEWLISDIVYFGRQNKVFKKFALQYFNPVSLYFHYKSLCRNNYLKFIKSKRCVTYKKYLYTYRGLINAKWVLHKKTVPPLNFSKTVKGLKGIIPFSLVKRINEILQIKLQGKEKEYISNITEMDHYVEEFLEDHSEVPQEKKLLPSLEILNKELRRIILK